jgi:putative ABC transport system permease protein
MLAPLTLFRTFILRDLAKDWIRTFLTVAGIALGVCVFLAISLANYTALAKFRETVDLVSGKANLEIRGTSALGIDQDLISSLTWLWSADGKFTPVIQENVIFVEPKPSQLEPRAHSNLKDTSRFSQPAKNIDNSDRLSENSDLVELLGIDLLADSDFKRVETALDSANYLSLFSPGAVLIGRRLAAKHNVQEGSVISLQINDKLKKFTVHGLLPAEGIGGVYSGNCVVCDLSTAQEALGNTGKITQIEIIVPPSAEGWVQKKLLTELPKSVTVTRPAQRGEQVEKITRSFEYNLIALTLIALMVGMFLIYNTMTISVIRRRPEIGTLRTLGVSRLAILSLFAGETLFFGIVGTTFGIIIGILLADYALKAIAGTFQHFYFSNPIESISFHPWTIIFAFFLGLSLTFLAGLSPVVEAAGIMPAEAIRRASYELKISRMSNKLLWLAILFFVVSIVFAMQSPLFDFPFFGYLAAFGFIFSFALVMPFTLTLGLPVVGKALSHIFEPEAKIAARILEGSLARTSVATASLMVGIAMMISLAIMIGSFRQTVTVWIDQTLKADLWLQSSARALGSQNARLDASVVGRASRVNGIAAIDPFVDMPIDYQGEPTNLGAGDFEVIKKFGHLHFVSNESNRDVISRVDSESAIVSETFAIKQNVKERDVIKLDTPNGLLALTVQGIYYDYASDLGYIVIPLPVYRKYFNDQTISSCAIYLNPNANPYEVRDKLYETLDASSNISIRTTGELKREAIKIFDKTFAVTYALHTIAIVISVLSVMNALFAMTMESKRDFGILRYLGASNLQIRKIVIIQAGILGLTGNIMGVLLGFVLSYLLIFVINKQSFGWTVQLQIPCEFIAQSTLLVFSTALLASLLPAKMAARTLAPSVVRDE